MSEVSQSQSFASESAESGAVFGADKSSIGAQLQVAREQRSWSVQFVADQLKLSQSQILALESNNFDKLPKLVIVRGFVRAYAKLLKIDANPLVALLPQDSEPVKLEASLRPALSTPFVESRTSLSGQQDNNRRYVIGICFLIVIVAVIVFFQRTEYGQGIQAWMFGAGAKPSTIQEPFVASPESAANASSVSASIAGQSASEPSVSNVYSASVSAVNQQSSQQAINSAPVSSGEVSTSPASSSIQNTTSQKVVENPNDSVGASTSLATSQNTSLPISESDALVLKFKQDSWIFVKSDNGKVLSSHMAKAGTEEVFSARQGLFMKIGNAAGVEANLRGKPFPIVADRDSKVANVSVK